MQVIYALSYRLKPLCTQLQSLALFSQPSDHKSSTIKQILFNSIYLYSYYLTLYILLHQGLHCYNTMDSLKQATMVWKPFIPLQYYVLLQKGGASINSNTLIPRNIFQLLRCPVHYALHYKLHCALQSTKWRVFSKNEAKMGCAQ